MNAEKPEGRIQRRAGVLDPRGATDVCRRNRSAPGVLDQRLGLPEGETLSIGHPQVFGHPAHLHIDRDRNGVHTTDLRPARVHHDPDPHRSDLGAAEEGVPGLSVAPAAEVPADFLGVSDAVVNQPGHGTLPRGQALRNPAPGVGIRAVFLADVVHPKEFSKRVEGHRRGLEGVEDLRIRVEEGSPGAPEPGSVSHAVHGADERQEPAHGPLRLAASPEAPHLRHRGQLTPKRSHVHASRREVEVLSVDVASDQLGQASGVGRGETHQKWGRLSRAGAANASSREGYCAVRAPLGRRSKPSTRFFCARRYAVSRSSADSAVRPGDGAAGEKKPVRIPSR